MSSEHKHDPNRIYRGGSAASFGLWRERAPGRWVFGMPVAGFTWRDTEAPDLEKLVVLVDAPTPPTDAAIEAGARIIHGNYEETPFNATMHNWAMGTMRAALKAVRSNDA